MILDFALALALFAAGILFTLGASDLLGLLNVGRRPRNFNKLAVTAGLVLLASTTAIFIA